MRIVSASSRPLDGGLLAAIVLAAALFLPSGSAADSGEAITLPGVPFFPQETNGCGPAVVASLLAYYGQPAELEELTSVLVVPTLNGTLPMDVEASVRARGLPTQVGSGSLNDIRDAIRRERPVIAFLDLGGLVSQGHFVVVVGFDDRRGALRVHSGLEPYATMAYRDFLASWKKTRYWQLTVDRPSTDGNS